MTRQVLVGSVPVGGGAPVTIQSMTNTDTRDAQATVEQIHRLEAAGCEIYTGWRRRAARSSAPPCSI